MSVGELVSLNLRSPAVLAFVLGAVAALVRSDLRFPEAVSSLLSTYLLFAIGLKGGIQLRHASAGDLWAPMAVTLILGVTTPVVAFVLARRFVNVPVADAVSLAAHYGSVSAVTFTAAETFAKAAGTLGEGFLPALVAVLEIPGIVVAMLIGSRVLGGRPLGEAVREVLAGKSVVLLIGGLTIGMVASEPGIAKIDPFFIGLFQGVLCLFLLDLGTVAGQRVQYLRRAGWPLVAFGVVVPLGFGTLGVVGGVVAGLSAGGSTVLGAMAASASYIAAPAAVRIGLPEADLGLSLGAAIGITFPFNLIVGIPLYSELASRLG